MARLIFIMGCTASGKGTLGRELALRVGGEILSVDSMKVYRRMDIGTAKPSAEVRGRIPHHLLDVVEPSEEFSVAEFVRLAEKAIAEISGRGRPILAVGGTPLYIKALSEGLFEGPGADAEFRRRLESIAEREGSAALHERLRGVDPVSAARLHPNDLRRLVRALEVHELTGKPISALQEQWDRDRTKHDCVFIALRWEKEIQSRRINERVRRMIAAGLVDEVRGLLAEGGPGQASLADRPAERSEASPSRADADDHEILRYAQNDGACAQNDGACAQNDMTVARDDGTLAQNDGACAQNDGTFAKNDTTAARNDGTFAQNDTKGDTPRTTGPLSVAARQALGYAEIIEHLNGRLDLEEAVERIKINTRRMAKSQRTWFRRFRNVNWIDLTPEADMEKVADDVERLIGGRIGGPGSKELEE